MSRKSRRIVEPLERRLLMAVLPVLNNNSSGAGSLYNVTQGAANGDTIDLRGLSGEIDVSNLGPAIKSLTFLGPGSDVLTIHGDTIFSVGTGISVTVSDLTLEGSSNGDSMIVNSHGSVTLNRVVLRDSSGGDEGAAIDSASGTLNVTDCSFINNSAQLGGAIHSQNDHVILDSCTFDDNVATASGGSFGLGGAVELRLVNYALIHRCTFVNNQAGHLGGAIYVEGTGTSNQTEAAGVFTLDDTTITNNTAMWGGGMYFSSFQGSATIANTILAGDHGTSASPEFENATQNIILTATHNLIGSDDFGPAPLTPLFVDGVNGNIVGSAANPIDPMLEALADNGGYTQTMMPLPGSPAINAGDGSWGETTDQRGVAAGMPYDIGSVDAQAPHFTTTAPSGGLADHQLTYNIVAADPGGLPLTITVSQLPAWLSFVDHGNGTATISGTPTNANAGLASVDIHVTDGTYYADQVMSLNVAKTNHAPSFTSTPPLSALTETPYTYNVVASDPDGDVLAINATVALPAWLTLVDHGDGTATLSGTPDDSATGHYSLTLTVNDGHVWVDQNFNITVSAVNHLPTLTLSTNQATVTQWFDATVTFNDTDGDPVSIVSGASGPGPVWLGQTTDGNGNLHFIGDPHNANAGDEVFTVRLSDGKDTVDRTFTIHVTPTYTTPTFTSTAITNATTGVYYNYSITTLDLDGDPLTITATGVPTWLTFTDFHDGTASLTGNATSADAGTSNIVLTVSDPQSHTDQSFTLTTKLPNHAPAFGSSGPVSGTVDQAYIYHIATSDADGDARTITAVSKPGWLTLTDNHDGTATLSGTPTQTGSSAVVLRVSDGTTHTDQSWSIGVVAGTQLDAAPVFDNLTAPPATADAMENYAYTFSASESGGASLSFALTAGPAWLSLVDHGDGTATVSGMPDITEMGATESVTVNVSDGATAVGTTFDVNVPAWRWRVDAGGTLAIVGSNDADNITVAPSGTGTLRVNYNGTIKNFAAASITSVQVYGQDGNDIITLSTLGIGTYVLGGAGNDTLIGGDQADNLVGGGGKDLIEGNAGDDRLSGLAGNDNIMGGGGKDRLYGGDGNDVLNGGTGADRFWGNAGSDVIFARDKYPDQLYPDASDVVPDIAQVDTLDSLNGVFTPYG